MAQRGDGTIDATRAPVRWLNGENIIASSNQKAPSAVVIRSSDISPIGHHDAADAAGTASSARSCRAFVVDSSGGEGARRLERGRDLVRMQTGC